MKKTADRRRQEEPVYSPGDFVLLSTRHLRMRNRPAKLQRRFVGLFHISERISRVAYRLELLAQWHIHPVFHSFLFKPWQESSSSCPVNALQLNSLKSRTHRNIWWNAFCAGAG